MNTNTKRYFTKRDGTRITLVKASELLNVSYKTLKYWNETRGITKLEEAARCAEIHHSKNPQMYSKVEPCWRLIDKDEVIRLGKYSKGQPDHDKIVCELFGINPCWADEMHRRYGDF